MGSVTILGGDIGGTNSRFQLFRVNLDDSALLIPLKPGEHRSHHSSVTPAMRISPAVLALCLSAGNHSSLYSW